MAVTITDLRATAFNGCDATTGWTGSVSVFTSEPTPVEASGCLGTQVSNATTRVYFTHGTSRDLSDSLVFVWVRAYGVMDTLANGGIGIVIGDGTNRMEYYTGGSDKAAFRHNDGPVEWTCFMLDTASLPTGKATLAGSEASMSWTAITQIGARYKTLAKSVGGVENCWCDIVRTGVEGLRITGGGSGTEGIFSEIAAADRSTADGGALGVCRLLATGVVGLQSPLTFGDTGSGSIVFESSGETVVFEPPTAGVADDRFWLSVVGGTGNTSVTWTGCSFICPAGVGAGLLAAESDADTFTMSGCLVKGFEQGITMLTTTTSGTFSITGTNFNGSGQISLGFLLQDGTFTGNTISESTSAATGALLLGSTGYTSGLDLTDTAFISGGTGHAIYITQAGTYDFSDLVFTGYGADSTTNAAVYNNSGGLVTINVTDCTGLTVRNGTSATTTLNNSVAISVRAVTSTGTAIENARVFLEESPGGTDIIDGVTDSLTSATGYVTTSYNYTTDQAVVGRVRKGSAADSPKYKTGAISGTITSAGFSATVVLVPDE